MNERVEEIRQRHDCPDHPMRGGFREPCYVCELLAALAQVERERDEARDTLREATINWGKHFDEARAEVERLKNQVTALKVTWADSEADLARMRAALEQSARFVHRLSPTCQGAFESCRTMACAEARAALEGRG